ncbi:MAG: hypothetical protein ACLU1W_00190 [Collinsella sp.]
MRNSVSDVTDAEILDEAREAMTQLPSTLPTRPAPPRPSSPRPRTCPPLTSWDFRTRCFVPSRT